MAENHEDPTPSPEGVDNDQRLQKLYKLAEGELSIESTPRLRELTQKIAEEMGLDVRFEPSKEFESAEVAIVKGNHAQISALIDKIRVEDVEDDNK